MQAYIQAHAHVSKHRCKADIIAIILGAAATGGTTKAKIYYRSFMTYQRLKGYLLLLEENGLIEYLKEEHLYKTTQKGIQALQAYNGMQELIDLGIENK
jgi:predicted transcriptional regulator